MATNKSSDEEVFNWVQTRKEVDLTEFNVESTSDKFKRKFKENPLVPIGAALTTLCLGYGLVCFKRGQSQMSQYMMRGRVLAQGFTVAAFITGLYFKASKEMEDQKPE